MAQSQYRQDQPTLQDIIAGAAARDNAGPSVPQPSDPSQVDMPGLLSPQDRSRLLSALLQPEDVGPAPTQTNPTASAVGMAFSGLGDALNALNAGRTRQPGFRSDYAGQAAYRMDQQRAEQQAYLERKAKAERNAKDRGVNYLLSADDRARIDAADRAGRKELKDMQIAQQQEALAQAKALAQQAHEFQQSEQTARLATETENRRLDREKDIAVAKIHASADGGDPHAKFDIKTLPEVMGNLNALAQAVPTYLAGDPAKGVAPLPEGQIWDRVQMGIEASGLSPDGKAAALAHAKKWVGQAITDFNRSQAAANQQGTTVEGEGVLPKLGRVLSGKANLYNPGP